MESATFDVNLNGRWRYDEFIGGDGILDEQLHFNVNTTLKGGWNLTGSLLLETFGYPSRDLPRLPGRAAAAPAGGADTVAFVGRPRIPNRDYVLSFETPEYKHFSGNAFILWGNDENFFEWSPGRIIISQLRGDLAADRQAPPRRHLCPAAGPPGERRQPGQRGPPSPAQDGVPALPAHLPAPGG